ncbi:UNVERIFIED_CONTAM: hypothetical protein BJ099_10436 [Lysinibacillus xylanilyticus]|nr:hypothetical protein [Lysinibacillus xylanilyticus]
MFFVRKRSTNAVAATNVFCAKAKRQQQRVFVCAKAKRQQKDFICAKAKRQRQHSTDAGQLAVIAWMR